MKIDLIKDEQVKGMFLLTVSEDIEILSKTDIGFKVNGDEVSFEYFINAINKNLNILLDKRVNQLANEKINKFMKELDKIRKDI